MPGHAEHQAAFAAALGGGAMPPGIAAAGDRGEAERRFAVYRNNVAASLSAALAARFPVCRRLVGPEFFAAVARLYAEADPPRSPVLAEWGEGFAAFLAAFPPLAGYPYMADVARIEFARGRACHAADAPPVAPAALAAAGGDALRLRLHPSVAVLRLSSPAVSIWTRHQPGAEDAAIAAGPEIALILRDASFTVRVRAIGPGDAAMLEALMGGSALLHAAARARRAEPAHVPQAILVHLMAAGAIVRAGS